MIWCGAASWWINSLPFKSVNLMMSVRDISLSSMRTWWHGKKCRSNAINVAKGSNVISIPANMTNKDFINLLWIFFAIIRWFTSIFGYYIDDLLQYLDTNQYFCTEERNAQDWIVITIILDPCPCNRVIFSEKLCNTPISFEC